MTEPEQLLTVTQRRTPEGPFVLEVKGELDHHSAPLLTEAVAAAPFDEQGVVVDLAGLTYCDSTGITVLVTAYQRSLATGSPLGLAAVGPEHMRVFGIIGLDQIFTFHPSTEAAVSALRR
ncbi:STAS domain-containing protein [Streptomyces sp. NPDC023723]|uniref:STAS domain-containing protein n=1 Tax=Streptomyces sp. NPDC023723 TaxID=3154323 RepID=UPI0033E31615